MQHTHMAFLASFLQPSATPRMNSDSDSNNSTDSLHDSLCLRTGGNRLGILAAALYGIQFAI